MVNNKAIEQLPSLPHILVQVLDGLQNDADTVDIAELIRQDVILASRLLTAVNASATSCHSIEQAILVLGEKQFHAMIVSHGIRQFFYPPTEQANQDFQIQLWKSSLACAHFARVLATLTSYHSLEEAYLCGLMANLGQSVLLEEYDQEYSQVLLNKAGPKQQAEMEQKLYGQNHSELAADIVETWQLSGFMADAIRYQHEPLDQIRDAHHLVKIIHCAKLAANTGKMKPELIDTAKQLFGLNEELTKELYSRNVADIDKLASELQITTQDSFPEARSQLGQRLVEQSELAQVSSGLLLANDLTSLVAAIDQCLVMNFGISRSVLFQYDDTQNLLFTHQANTGTHADFKLLLETGRSLTADSLLEKMPMQSDNHQSLTVIDRQLLHFCGGEILCCQPLRHEDNAIGVLVFAINQDRLDQLKQRNGLLLMLCKQIAQSLAIVLKGSLGQSTDGMAAASAYQHKISEAVHEASNPLSIIHNYLEMLRIKLGDEHDANESLGLIKEEIERVGSILNKLKEQPDPIQEQEQQPKLNVNRVIEDTAQIIKESICVAKDLTLQLHLDKELTEIQGDSDQLKQILTNLLKNAAEALPEGGQISINSDNHASFSGRDCVSISVLDNGPGLPEEIKGKLFYPVTSSKGENHSGLGLSIVKKLVDTMNGYIVCRSNKNTGTEFQILLPKTLTD